ncbi:MAG: arginyltransferase [Chromatiales bacterium]|nr:arginyltransferase [Chromatiales bacterium]
MAKDQAANSDLLLYITPEHNCAYLPDRQARTVFVDPNAEKDPWLYQALIDKGFRRSGDMIYRPECDGCQACISVRIPVNSFHPNRSQRRAWKRGSSINVTCRSSDDALTYYPLYEKYIKTRHPNGEMSDTSEAKYLDFLTCHWLECLFFEFNLADQLVAVAVTDVLPSGLSAVYTFFDPDFSHLSLGTYAILWQIERARQLNLKWLYLGYWVPHCQKMAYKNQFTPIQTYIDQQWQHHTKIPVIDDNTLFPTGKVS